MPDIRAPSHFSFPLGTPLYWLISCLRLTRSRNPPGGRTAGEPQEFQHDRAETEVESQEGVTIGPIPADTRSFFLGYQPELGRLLYLGRWPLYRDFSILP